MTLQISFRDMTSTPALEETVRKAADKLAKTFPAITSCRVMVETPHRGQATGARHHVRIDLTMPGKEIAVTRDADDRAEHEDAYVAIRDAFRTARREVTTVLGRKRQARHATA